MTASGLVVPLVVAVGVTDRYELLTNESTQCICPFCSFFEVNAALSGNVCSSGSEHGNLICRTHFIDLLKKSLPLT